MSSHPTLDIEEILKTSIKVLSTLNIKNIKTRKTVNGRKTNNLNKPLRT